MAFSMNFHQYHPSDSWVEIMIAIRYNGLDPVSKS